MKNRWKMAGLFLMAGLLAAGTVMPAFAASRKKISSVNVVVTADIQPETRFGEENIEIEVKGGGSKYSYDYYEIENVGFEWADTDVPEISIYLKAEDGYYFSLTAASAVKLSGATYVKATKQDSSETLKLVVKLPSLAESVGALTEVSLSNNGYAMWEAARGAGSYEVRLYRNGEGIGASILSTKDTFYKFQDVMTKAGSYYVKVRPLNGLNPENKGEWVESAAVTLDQAQANAIRNGEAGGMPLTGTWKSNGEKWWYTHSDGTYTTNGWEEIKGQWYFFDAEGFMQTGWIEWEGNRYYCKDNTGEMLRNTAAPDGTILDENGRPKND